MLEGDERYRRGHWGRWKPLRGGVLCPLGGAERGIVVEERSCLSRGAVKYIGRWGCVFCFNVIAISWCRGCLIHGRVAESGFLFCCVRLRVFRWGF